MFVKRSKSCSMLLLVVLTVAVSFSSSALATEPFLGQIILVGFNFPPRGFTECDGQLLPIASNTALFSLLGTIYGGDGRSTFGLPDLRGRVPMHNGNGPGLTPRTIGQKAGAETVQLTVGEMPTHRHNVLGYGDAGDTAVPTANTWAINGREDNYSTADPNVAMDPLAITQTGSSQAHPNMQPYLVLNYCIALTGIFPSRN